MWFNVALVIFLIVNFLIIFSALGRLIKDQEFIAKSLSELVQAEASFYGELSKVLQESQRKELEKTAEYNDETLQYLRYWRTVTPDELQKAIDIIRETSDVGNKKHKEKK